MALSAGTVSIHPTTGAVSGSGYARDLYDIEGDAQPALAGDLDAYVDGVSDATGPLSTDPPGWLDGGSQRAGLRVAVLAQRQTMATKCNAQAAAAVALVQTATVTTAVPSTPGTYIAVVS
jgi:hypothetical protein